MKQNHTKRGLPSSPTTPSTMTLASVRDELLARLERLEKKIDAILEGRDEHGRGAHYGDDEEAG